MKKYFLFLLLFFLCAQAISQTPWQPVDGRGFTWKGGKFETLHIPQFCGEPFLPPTDPYIKSSAIAWDSCSHELWIYDGSTEAWTGIFGGIPDTINVKNPLGVLGANHDTLYLKSDSLPQLRYKLATRSVGTWTDTTLADKKYVDSIAGTITGSQTLQQVFDAEAQRAVLNVDDTIDVAGNFLHMVSSVSGFGGFSTYFDSVGVTGKLTGISQSGKVINIGAQYNYNNTLSSISIVGDSMVLQSNRSANQLNLVLSADSFTLRIPGYPDLLKVLRSDRSVDFSGGLFHFDPIGYFGFLPKLTLGLEDAAGVISGTDAVTTDAAGGTLIIQGGKGLGIGNGGGVELIGNDANAIGSGGATAILSGNGGTTSGDAGQILIQSGAAAGSGNGGNIVLTTGAAGGAGVNGNLVITVLPSYANNAAALAGGLTAGMVYINGDALQIVH